MRVYEYGAIKPIYAFCTGCGAKLEFLIREAKTRDYRLGGLQNDGSDRYVNCPICGEYIFEYSFAKSIEEIII